MNQSEILNLLIEKNNYKSYLEIGIANGANHLSIKCDYKIGVDPDKTSKNTTHYLTSDDFFKINKDKFDIIFIDGSHEHYQVFNDIKNSLNILNEDGVIVMHDCNPTSLYKESLRQNGTCWRAFVQAREELPIKAFVVDTDEGIGILKKSTTSDNFNLELEKNYLNLSKHRKELLNLKTLEFFLKWVENTSD